MLCDSAGLARTLDRGRILCLLVAAMSFAALCQPARQARNVGVLDLDAAGITTEEAVTLTNRLRSELHKSGSCIVLERSKMGEILSEQGFQQTGCTGSECLVRAGQLLNVERMVGGSVGRVGNTYAVELRMIDVSTGGIVATATFDLEGKIDKLLTQGISRCVAQLLSDAPADVARERPIVKANAPSTATARTEESEQDGGQLATLGKSSRRDTSTAEPRQEDEAGVKNGATPTVRRGAETVTRESSAAASSEGKVKGKRHMPTALKAVGFAGFALLTVPLVLLIMHLR